jgi:Staphylococcal nuclease homologue
MERMARSVTATPIRLRFSPSGITGSAAELAGSVVGITDGDTLTLLYDGHQQVRVRLAEIDSPESRQPYGNRARQELSDLAFGKDVRMTVRDIDRYGRTVDRVYAGSYQAPKVLTHPVRFTVASSPRKRGPSTASPLSRGMTEGSELPPFGIS